MVIRLVWMFVEMVRCWILECWTYELMAIIYTAGNAPMHRVARRSQGVFVSVAGLQTSEHVIRGSGTRLVAAFRKQRISFNLLKSAR